MLTFAGLHSPRLEKVQKLTLSRRILVGKRIVFRVLLITIITLVERVKATVCVRLG